MRQKHIPKKWIIWLVLLAMVVGGCRFSSGVEQNRIRQVGVLVGSDFRLAKLDGLMESLPEYGYYLDKNIELIVKNAQGDSEGLLPLAQELVDSPVEVIMTAGRVETEAVKEALGSRQIPLVFMGLTGIHEEGLVKDLLHPKEGLTGVHNDHAYLSGKRLEFLVELLPQVEQVLVLYDPEVIPTWEGLDATRKAAAELNVGLIEAAVATEEEIIDAVQQFGHEVEGILLLPSVFLESIGPKLQQTWAGEWGLPVMGVEHSEEMGLFAIYGIPLFDQGYQSGRILAKVLSGQKVEEIPVEPPAVLKLTVNLNVAKALGLTVDSPVLGYAELLYEEEGGEIGP